MNRSMIDIVGIIGVYPRVKNKAMSYVDDLHESQIDLILAAAFIVQRKPCYFTIQDVMSCMNKSYPHVWSGIKKLHENDYIEFFEPKRRYQPYK